MPYCMKCGSPMKKSEKFCALCGTPAHSNVSNQQGSSGATSENLSNKSIGELKTLARAGNLDAAFEVGEYYTTKENDYFEADKWFALTYTGSKIHIGGLLVSLKLKRVLLEQEIKLTVGFRKYPVEKYDDTIQFFTLPAKTIIRLWQNDNTILDQEYYADAMSLLSEVNLYRGRVLLPLDSNKAKDVFFGCTQAAYLENSKKFIANLGYSICDLDLAKTKLETTQKAAFAFNYFSQNRGLINRDLNFAEEYLVMMFGTLVSDYVCGDLLNTFLPYLKSDSARGIFLEHVTGSSVLTNDSERSLLYQLNLCANGMYQFEQNNDRLDELKGKRFKSAAINSEIAQLEANNSQLASYFAPFLKNFIPDDLWLASDVDKLRYYVKEGYASSLREAIYLLYSKKM